MMKKVITILLAMAMMLSLVACGSGNNGGNGGNGGNAGNSGNTGDTGDSGDFPSLVGTHKGARARPLAARPWPSPPPASAPVMDSP